MKKSIKLTESQLIRIIKQSINEQESFDLKPGNKIYFKSAGGAEYMGIIKSNSSGILEISGNSGISYKFNLISPTQFKGGPGPQIFTITKTESSTPPITPNIKQHPIPEEINGRELDLFVCPDYDTMTDKPSIPRIKIVKVERILPSGINDKIDEYIEPYVKLTTDRNIFKTGEPLVLYFVCSRDGFITNHKGSSIDNINVLISQFDAEAGKTVQNCKIEREKIDLDLPSVQRPLPRGSEMMTPSPNPTRTSLSEQNNEVMDTIIPTIVFNRPLREVLLNVFCQPALAKNVNSQGSNVA